jgi:hypothetical protein
MPPVLSLFVILLRGSYAIEVKIVRAEDLGAAMLVASKLCAEPFNRVEVKELDAHGAAGEVFSAHYVE